MLGAALKGQPAAKKIRFGDGAEPDSAGLHPSWATRLSAKAQEKQAISAALQKGGLGKKVVFGDD